MQHFSCKAVCPWSFWNSQIWPRRKNNICNKTWRDRYFTNCTVWNTVSWTVNILCTSKCSLESAYRCVVLACGRYPVWISKIILGYFFLGHPHVFLWLFSVTPGKFQHSTLKTGHVHFLPYPIWFIIHSCLTMFYWLPQQMIQSLK